MWMHSLTDSSPTPLSLVIRWTPTIAQAVWRTCRLQRLSLKRTGETGVQTHRESYISIQHSLRSICISLVSLLQLIYVIDVIFIHSQLFVCYTAGVRTVLTVHAACTHCPLGPPTSQLLCLMILPRRP